MCVCSHVEALKVLSGLSAGHDAIHTMLVSIGRIPPTLQMQHDAKTGGEGADLACFRAARRSATPHSDRAVALVRIRRRWLHFPLNAILLRLLRYTLPSLLGSAGTNGATHFYIQTQGSSPVFVSAPNLLRRSNPQ